MYSYTIRIIDKKPYVTSGTYLREITGYDSTTDAFTRKNDCKLHASLVCKSTLLSILAGFV